MESFHVRHIVDAIGHPDKEIHEIPGATHYYAGPGQAVGIVTDWLVKHDFATLD